MKELASSEAGQVSDSLDVDWPSRTVNVSQVAPSHHAIGAIKVQDRSARDEVQQLCLGVGGHETVVRNQYSLIRSEPRPRLDILVTSGSFRPYRFEVLIAGKRSDIETGVLLHVGLHNDATVGAQLVWGS